MSTSPDPPLGHGPVTLRVTTGEGVRRLQGRLDRLEQSAPGRYRLWVCVPSTGKGDRQRLIPFRIIDPLLSLSTLPCVASALRRMARGGEPLSVTEEVDLGRPCPTCGREGASPYCTGCGAQRAWSPPTPPCGGGKAGCAVGGGGRYCGRCGERRPEAHPLHETRRFQTLR